VKVSLEKTYPVPASADTTWALLQDVEAVAGCMPGARITERVDERHYKGTVAVRFGPANMTFRGEVEVVSIETDGRTLQLIGKGTDTTGGSGASMDLTARVEAIDGDKSNLVGKSEVSMSGKAATFGGRLAVPVAEQILQQFATNFAAKAKERQVAPTTRAPTTEAADDPVATPAPLRAPPQTRLNALALLWNVIKATVRSWFSTRKA
jgi:carbon monoxide dehydrogenase subunit G